MMISVFCGVGAGLLLSFAWGSAPLVALALMVVTLSSVMIWGAMHALAHEDARSGASSSMGPAFKACWERYDVVLLAMVFYGGIMGIAGIFVLPALLAGGMLLPFMPVVVQGRRGPLGGLMRTAGLMGGKGLELGRCWLVRQAVMMGVALMGGAVVGASSLLGVSTEWGGGLASGSIG